MSNTTLHHVADPTDLTTKGGAIFVRDLARPRSVTEIDGLVQKSVGEPAGNDASVEASHLRQRARFEAALTLEEVRERVKESGAPASALTTASDRYSTLAHEKT